MSEIRHQWNGTVLTVISDSGASSADLVGPKGDRGPRGPQGPGGIIYNEDGEVVVDLSEYYSKSEVDDLVENVEVDLSDYATKSEVLEVVTNEIMENGGTNEEEVAAIVDERIGANEDLASKAYVSTEIAKAQLAEVAGDVDLSGFATKDDLDNVQVEIDNKTIVKLNGALQTAIGGSVEGYHERITPNVSGRELTGGRLFWLRDDKQIQPDDVICIQVKFIDGTVDTIVGSCPKINQSGSYTMTMTTLDTTYIESIITIQNGGQWFLPTFNDTSYEDIVITEATLSLGTIPAGTYTPIDANFIPVDGETIIVNSQGKLQVVGGAGSLASSEEVYY